MVYCWRCDYSTVMAAEKVAEVSLESIRLLEVKGRTATAEPISTYVQVRYFLKACCSRENSFFAQKTHQSVLQLFLCTAEYVLF